MSERVIAMFSGFTVVDIDRGDRVALRARRDEVECELDSADVARLRDALTVWLALRGAP